METAPKAIQEEIEFSHYRVIVTTAAGRVTERTIEGLAAARAFCARAVARGGATAMTRAIIKKK